MSKTAKTRRPKKARLKRLHLPHVVRSATIELDPDLKGFPVPHYSYSSLVKLSTNPFMFKVNHMNGDFLDTLNSASSVLGTAGHRGVEAYVKALGEDLKGDDGEAIKAGLLAASDYLETTSDGMIGWNKVADNRQKLNERNAKSYLGYVRALNIQARARKVLMCETVLKHKVVVDGMEMPVPLKGVPDLVIEDKEGRVIIEDHKFTSRFSDAEAIDGAKLMQAAILYLLVQAELGVVPYAMVFREYKVTDNADKTAPQFKEYEIVYGDHPLIFDFFFRFYEDATNALLGKAVFLPNLHAMYDKDVSILAYIHRLDVNEERDKVLRKMKVENITDFLKKSIERDGMMKKYLETVTEKFVSANTLNYKDMTTEEQIKMKLAEHGIAVDFHSKIEGSSVTLYRYEPSIGLKMSHIQKFARDIEQVVKSSGVRILAPIPNSDLVGFEVPNAVRTFPEGLPANDGFKLPFGVDVMGNPLMLDIRETPHVLISGATGAGKSVFMECLVRSVAQIEHSDIFLIDPKMVELKPLAHMATSYADDVEGATEMLSKLCLVMDTRYKSLQKAKKRSIAELAPGKMNYVFVFIDEFADLIMQDVAVGGKSPIETAIIRLAQKGRAAGIHLVIATQRPSVKVVSGTIKANFPTRVAFRTATATDSQVVFDQAGAEKLLGKGDGLVMTPSIIGLTRIQGYHA